MTREMLEARIAELRKVLDQIQANGNATIGAISECEYWLAQLDAQEKENAAEVEK